MIKRKKKLHRIGTMLNRRNSFSLEKALSKIYEIKGYKQKKRGYIFGNLTFPSILIGHKVKLILIK